MGEKVDIPAETLSRLIGLIYGAASDDDLWPSLLQAMADFLMQTGAHDARHVSTAETDAIVGSWFGDTSNPLPSTASAAEQQVFQLLAPHFVRAWDMRQTQADAETHRQISDSVLDRLPVGVALVEDTGAVVSMNRALRLILNNNDGLVLVAGRMESRPRKLLEEALREVASAAAHAGTRTAFRLEQGAGSLSVLVSKLQPTNETTPLAMLWVASADVPLVPESGLRELFGLTAAEARLAQRLVRGLTLEESAQDLGTTTNTAKTQLKAVFAKVGVRRQPELVQAIWSTPLWLDQAGGHLNHLPLGKPASPTLATRACAGDGRMVLPDGRALAWSDSGDPDGLPVVQMHGLSCSRHLRHPDDALLREASIRLIIPERPGTGDSDPMPGRKVADWPADVQALADHLKLDRFAVLGYSAGMPYAFATAQALPERVSAVFIVAATPPIERVDDIKAYSAHFRMALMVARYMPNLLPPLLHVVVRSIRKDVYRYIESILKSMPDVDQQVFRQAAFRENYAQELLAGVKHGGQHFVVETLLNVHGWQVDGHRFAMPVEFFHGALDWHVSINAARGLVRRIPGAQLHEVGDGGHFLIYSHWRNILQTMRERLSCVA